MVYSEERAEQDNKSVFENLALQAEIRGNLTEARVWRAEVRDIENRRLLQEQYCPTQS